MKNIKGVLLFLGISMLGMGKEFTVMSYNIYGARLTNGIKIGESIKKYNPDFVSLQEVDKFTRRSRNKDITLEIAKALGYNYYYFQKAMDFDGGEYGISIISKYPVKKLFRSELPSIGNEKRQILIAELDSEELGKKVTVLNTHLDYKTEIKEKEMRHLLAVADVIEGDVKFMSGDFNFLPTSEHYRKITENWKDSYTEENKEKTKKAEDARIDYIFSKSSRKVKVKKSQFINDDTEEWTKLSDHLPYISVFDIK